MKLKKLPAITIFILFSLPFILHCGEIQVITNTANHMEVISKQEIQEIFLGEKILWKDGTKIKIADNLDKRTAEEFYRTFIGKDSSHIKKIWIKKMLRGEMSPPESFKSIDELLDFVSTQKYCIGFIADGELPNGIKALKVVE